MTYSGKPIGANTRPVDSAVAYARLIAGDYSKDLEGVQGGGFGGPWTKAAKSIAKQVDNCIKANADQIRSRRSIVRSLSVPERR